MKDTSSVAATASATVIVEAKEEKVDPSKVARTSSTATSISRGREGVTSTATTTSSARTGVVSAAMPSTTASALQAAALANSGASRASASTSATHRELDYTVNDKVEKLEAKLVKVEKEGKTETAERIEAKIEKYVQDPTYIDPATVVVASAGPAATATGEKPPKADVDPQDAKTDKTVVAVPAETLTEIPSVPVADGHHAASEDRTEGEHVHHLYTYMTHLCTRFCDIYLTLLSPP